VVVTHSHVDHFSGIRREDGGLSFPNATHYVGRADWEGLPADLRQHPLYDRTLGEAERTGLLRMVDSETEIVPRLTLVPSPGESPGHLVGRLASDGEVFWFLGDLVHHQAEIAHSDWISEPHQRDPEAMAASRAILYP